MSSLSAVISASIVLIYIGLNAWPDARISKLLLSSFGPSANNGEARSHFLARVAAYAFSWMTLFAAVGVGSYWATTHFGLEFESEVEKLIYFFFVWSAVVYTAWITVRSIINIGFLKITGRDWIYVLTDDDVSNVA